MCRVLGTHLLLGLRAEFRWGSARYVPGVVAWSRGVTLLLRFFGSCPSARLCRVLGYKAVDSDRGGFIGFLPAMSPVVVFRYFTSGGFLGAGTWS
jgi:hypothetical protein